MRYLVLAVAFFVFDPHGALAQAQWNTETDQGVRSAGIETGGDSLVVRCRLAPQESRDSIDLRLGGTGPSGEVTFAFRRQSFSATLVDGSFTVDSREDLETYRGIVRRLKLDTSVRVEAGDGDAATFSLRGSSRAIADCDAQALNNYRDPAPAAETAPAATEEREPEPEPVTQPVPVKGEYHRIEGCDHEGGFGIMVYRFAKRAELEFTEICFDRDGGNLTAAESASGFSLAREDSRAQVFEAAASEAHPDSPPSIRVQKYTDPRFPDLRFGGVSFSYTPAPDAPSSREDALGYDLFGYLFRELGNPATLPDTFQVYLTGLDYARNTLRTGSRKGSEAPIVQLQGGLSFQNGAAKGKLQQSAPGFGTGQGEIELRIAADGSITGGGEITLESDRRIAAHSADWRTTRWEIVELHGHVLGSDGQMFLAHAIAQGQTVDHDGFVHPVKAAITISGVGPKWQR